MKSLKYLLLAGLACLSMQVQAKVVTNVFTIGKGPFYCGGNPLVTPLSIKDIRIVGDPGVGKFFLKTMDPNGNYDEVFVWWNPDMFPEEMMTDFYWGNERGEPVDQIFASGQGFCYNFDPTEHVYVLILDRNTWRLYDQEEDIP